jgi:CHASE1-domain containing sensor protein
VVSKAVELFRGTRAAARWPGSHEAHVLVAEIYLAVQPMSTAAGPRAPFALHTEKTAIPCSYYS